MPSPIHLIRVAGLMIVAAAAIAAPASAQVSPAAGMLRYPDVSKTHVVFAYANDLWLVDREGGQATPLVSPPGQELFPRFSNDGNTIAFMGSYEGNLDLYTIPVTGGIATRVTHHPAGEFLSAWVGADKLIFTSAGMSGLGRMGKLFTVSTSGGLPEALPVPYGALGTISDDGAWLAYTPHSRDQRTWKRYRGGMATDIWLFNLQTNESKKITDWEGTDSIPMWHGKKVYYLSDEGESHRLNIWVYDTTTSRREQVTRFSEYDVKWPSIGPGPDGGGELVFQNGPRLYLLNLRNNQSNAIAVTIPGDRPKLRRQSINAADFIAGWDISATGKRAVVEARGDVWTLPAEKGMSRNLTRTDGVAERMPAWSPDGRWIAYLSDATGEYELYITQSDGRGETKQLTTDGGPYKYNPQFSPDSKLIYFSDKTGAMWLVTIETGEKKQIDFNAGAANGPTGANFSHDTRWLTYSRINDVTLTPSIWLYNIETGEKQQVTSDMFADGSPAFDRKGDYLYFASTRSVANPEYSALDTTFIYENAQVLLAVPLREDIDYPWAAESDEEEWKDEEAKEEDGAAENGDAEDADDDGDADEADAEDDDADDEDAADDDEQDDEDEGDDENGDEDDDEEEQPAKPDDGVSGTYEGEFSGTIQGQPMPPGMTFTIELTLNDDGSLTGSVTVPMGSGTIKGTYDKATGECSGEIETDSGDTATFTGTVKDGSLKWEVTFQGENVTLNGERTSKPEEDKKDEKSDKPREVVEIVFEGFERRAIQLPVSSGNFGNLAVNDKNQLIYARFGEGGGGIKLFDLDDDKKEEQTVAAGSGFGISGDGKMLIVPTGNSARIIKAAAGGSGETVKTANMIAQIDPRDEWMQVFTDTWRIFRDYFYVDNMHGVNWKGIYDLYKPMIADCNSREDVSFVIGEMISELNAGHSYYWGGETDFAPQRSVGMLGCDFTLENGAYRISKIYEGGPWDADARGPLSWPGIDVKLGDYLLAVNRVPVDASKDPWAAFINLAGQEVELTVSEKPERDDDARDVIVPLLSSEGHLRYRAWIERNRAYVDEKSDGQVGYIYVPDTGINGQNDLFRQFYGQLHKKALIIDERWNGGGQIPTRFIELLNRPRTNYWAVRNGRDWPWPPDSHQGPKCMLINGLAGSGGDMFPWLFRQADLGKIIGTRTWGGLVGISGNPSLIDGGSPAVPTFGFYERDGTWGVEGHGVDPDIHVLDDPAKMLDGADPQLDTAVNLMLEEIQTHPYTPAKRPPNPDRAGMGVREEDK